MFRILTVLGLFAFTFALDYPAAAFLQHGLDPKFWPPGAIKPNQWFTALASFQLGLANDAYWQIIIQKSQAFIHGGWSWPLALPVMSCVAFIVLMTKAPAPSRDASNIFGAARFANDEERAAMRKGLELGIDPKTGCAVRVSVQGTLVTLAPPRTGKTSGLIIPNLAYPERLAWSGPAVVIDPKGEVYRAVADRRRALGRRVICLNPMNLAAGADRWNPLPGRKASDVLYLQHTALALLPEPTGNDEASAYFRNRAVDLITGAMQIVLNGANPSIIGVQRLMADDETFVRELQRLLKKGKSHAASAALDILLYDTKSRDQIKSTASQAFQWLADERMQRLVGQSTFDLSSLSTGSVDLFITVPPEDTKILAPFLRWLLADLFNCVRRNRPKERIVVFLDEAAAVGRFEAILTAAGELPGYGLSLWTFWQSRSQIVKLYGDDGAATIVNTAEIVTVSNLSSADPDESERWSRALGNYTGRVETSSHAIEGKANATISYAPQAVPLMTKEALVTMPSNELLAFSNSEKYARYPLRLHKTVAHTDARFKKIIQNVPPVDATG